MAALESLKAQDRLLDRQAANSIRRQIVDGTMPPGHRLLETELARNLEVSRGTIRSALLQLTSEGLVNLVAFTKWVVAPVSVYEAWELYTLRSVLEGLAARLAAERATPEGRAEFEQAFVELETVAKAGDSQAIIDADFNLHSVFVGMSGHRRLIEQHSKLIQQVRFQMTHIGLTTRDYHHLLTDHRALKDAINGGEVEKASQLAETHNSAEVERLWTASVKEKSAEKDRENPG